MRRSLALLIALVMPAYGQDMILSGAGSPVKVSAGGGGYQGPGDKVPGAFAYWGFRAYDNTAATTHQKVVKVCPSTGLGASCVDVLANTNGTITLPAAGACGGANCTLVTTVYDQSRANNCSSGTAPCDATQATTANMPTLNTTGMPSMTTLGGFGGLFVNTANISLSTTAFSVSTVASPLTFGTSGGMLYIVNGNTGSGMGFNNASAGASIAGTIGTFNSSNIATGGAYASVQFLIANSSNTNGSKIDLEGTTTNGTNSGGLGWATAGLYIIDATADSIGFMEAGVWNSDISSSFALLLANQQAYCTSIGGSC